MDGQAIACHSKCISFLSFHPPQPFLKAMEFSFEPFLGAKIKRQNKICSVLQEALMNSQETTTRLPAEIWLQIAKLLVGSTLLPQQGRLGLYAAPPIVALIFLLAYGLVSS